MKKQLFFSGLALCVMSVYAYAGDFNTFAFPQKGQTPEQQKEDEGFCTKWSGDQTGLNPEVLKYQQKEAASSQQQAAATEQASQPGAGRTIGRTALRGVALGAINGNMDDGAGKGAAMGAAMGISKARTAGKEQQVQGVVANANAATQKVQADTQTYLKAYSACMEGKGYSIR